MMNNYNEFTPVNIDVNRLLQLGFTTQTIQQLQYVYYNGGKITPAALQQYGYSFEEAKKIAYAYAICVGRVQINTKEEIMHHLKKMFGSAYKISMQDLAISKVTAIPKVAVVSNIDKEPYTIWNSRNYRGKEALYKVIDSTPSCVTIETPRKPVIRYGMNKIIPEMLEIKGVRINGNAVVKLHKDYCHLCNRFAVIASLRNPEFHLGKYELLCFEGTRIYVFATNIGTKEHIRYSMGNQRVYDYGIFPQEIKPKLDKVTKILYTHLKGVGVQYHNPTTDYHVVTVVNNEEKTDKSSDILE